jgi:uncharacterized membrane protein
VVGVKDRLAGRKRGCADDRAVILQAPAVDCARTPGTVAIRGPLRRERCFALFGATATFGVPFAAFTSLVLYHFYVRGSFLLDSGLLAYLAAHGGAFLPTPRVLGGQSFFATHLTPIFLVTAQLRRWLPVSDAQFFALFIGLCHALPGLGVFWLLRSGFGLRRPMGIVLAALLGMAFSFNGLALAIARYPHFEMLIVGGAILFAVALSRGKHLAAALWFALCLATREDAGFHLFAILFVLIALNRWHAVPWSAQRAEIVFAAVALVFSLAEILVQMAIAEGQSSLVRIYLGDPPFGSLSPEVLAGRLLGYFAYRTYLVVPAAIAVLWAVRTRNPYILVGYVAFLPYLLLHLTARSEIAATLSGYYAYPFMIAAFWPLLGVWLNRRRLTAQQTPTVPVLAFAAMIAGSFAAVPRQYNPGGLEFPASLISPPSLARMNATERAIAALSRSKPMLGKVVVDDSVLALAPDDFEPGETLLASTHAPPDTAVYFDQGYGAKAVRAMAAAADLTRNYRVSGTSIRLATDRAIDPSLPLAALLVPADGPD